MTDLEFVQRRIDILSEKLKRAEQAYHHATLHGSVPERTADLAECQRIRALLIETVHCRDEIAGGKNDGHKSGTL